MLQKVHTYKSIQTINANGFGSFVPSCDYNQSLEPRWCKIRG